MKRDSNQTSATNPAGCMPITDGNTLFTKYLAQKFLVSSNFWMNLFLTSPQSYLATLHNARESDCPPLYRLFLNVGSD